MVIKREEYVKQLADYRLNGQVKVITGLRRSGKSFLLKKLYKDYLLADGVQEKDIFEVSLDLARDIKYRNPLELAKFAREKALSSHRELYLFVDEIRMSDVVDNPYNPQGAKITFYDALNDLRSLNNLDIYVTGSNSKMLSGDILTHFRGRSDEVRMHPLSFAEYYAACGKEKHEAFDEYAYFGGMPFLLSRPNERSKRDYLQSLFDEVFLKDILERNNIDYPGALSLITDVLCSAIGSLTNPVKINNTLLSNYKLKICVNTVRNYLNYLLDAFLFSESKRFDVKGREYIDSPSKFYCEDVGLRNARLGFRQQEMPHILENIIYNELRVRGFQPDVGIVYSRQNDRRIPCEIDFVVRANGKITYIQSAFSAQDENKARAELRPFSLVNDNFPKIIVRGDIGKRFYNDDGVLNISVTDFLLDKSVI